MTRRTAEAPPKEQAAHQRNRAEWRKKHLNWHRRFVRTYPDLAAWPGLPLSERLGWRGPEAQDQRRGPGDGFDAARAALRCGV